LAERNNHHHQRRANGERRDDTRSSPDSGATNCQDEKESGGDRVKRG